MMMAVMTTCSVRSPHVPADPVWTASPLYVAIHWYTPAWVVTKSGEDAWPAVSGTFWKEVTPATRLLLHCVSPGA